MSDNQKYYYLKLVDNFFDRDEMIILESMPDGYLYSNILLKLYLRSLKNTGKLMFNDRIPYNSTMLANVTRHPVAVVEKAVDIFRQLGLVEILDNGAIYMLDIQDFIGKSSTEADRKRNYRRRIDEEKKQLSEGKGQTAGQMSQQSSENTGQMSDQISTIIRDRDRDRDRDRPTYIEEDTNNKLVGKFAKLYENNIGVINGVTSEWLIDMTTTIDYPLFKRAIEICTERGKTNLGYLKGIINNWTNKNIHTMEQLQAYKLQQEQDKPKQQGKFDFLDKPKTTSNDEELDEEALEMLRKLEEWGCN
ncbi:phage replisome organizer N-terminal domain-containing protein [Intestinibacter sp.]|uniref:phage replisome organizer N-terminal domain-containing protein n=1 Tax=Intestinibacter sp. TaxID=1965304 RepID=UPI00307D2307